MDKVLQISSIGAQSLDNKSPINASSTDLKTNQFVRNFDFENPQNTSTIDPQRVSLSSPSTALQEEYKNQVLSMDKDLLQAIDKKLGDFVDNNENFEPNYLIKIQKLIGELLAQFSKISDRKKENKASQTVKYTKANEEWGSLQKETGNRGMYFAGASVVLLCAQFVVPANGRDLVSFLANQGCSNLANMFNSETQARQRLVEGISQIAMSEINASMNEATPNIEQYLRVLEEAMQVLRGAARAS